MAEVDENRTHQGRDTPRIGFEDREPHQRTNYLRNLFLSGNRPFSQSLRQSAHLFVRRKVLRLRSNV